MTPLRRVMNDAMREWIAHLCNIDVAQEREWAKRQGAAQLAACEARIRQRRADLRTAQRYLAKHAPNAPQLTYRID